jgi:electron transfer flavoprotein beta subunit
VTDGYQVIEATLPALITVSNELGEARYATLKGIMAAAKKQPTIWKPADIGIDATQIGEAGRMSKLIKLFQPVSEGKCEFIEADSPADAGTKLADKLREAKLI